MTRSDHDLLIAAHVRRLLMTLPPHSDDFRNGVEDGLRASLTGLAAESMTCLQQGQAARDAWELGVQLGKAAWREMTSATKRQAARELVGKRTQPQLRPAVERDAELARVQRQMVLALERLAA